jgi:hypothetical protein
VPSLGSPWGRVKSPRALYQGRWQYQRGVVPREGLAASARARGDAAPKLSQDSAFMHDLEGVFSAMDREDWHSALVGIDNAVQARVALLRGETARRHT